MKKSLARPERFHTFWGVLLLIGFGGSSLQAADDSIALHFYQAPTFLIGCLVVLAALAFATWQGMQHWRARLSRQRDEEIARVTAELNQKIEAEVERREAAELALDQSQDMTLRQERLAAVGQLAAGLAHEFNNILTIIQGHASLLLDNPKMDEDSIKSIAHVTEGVERITTLVKQMLAFSRKQVMQQQSLVVTEALGESADMLRRLLGSHIVLNFDIVKNLPPIIADPEMLQQILANLAVNARDAMSNGGQLTINATFSNFAEEELAGKPDRHAGRFIHLSITDTGPGIDPSVINHIFEPFFTTKEVGKGTGLGLATVYGMVKQQSGWIEVDSTLRVGTTFNIYLPAGEPKPAKTQAAATKTLAPTAPAAGMAKDGVETILVVEDEAVLRELVREILEAHRYRVLDAASGREALQVWENNKSAVNLLLTDLSMPDGMSGQDLAAKLQAENPKLPIIFSSGYSQEALEGKDAHTPGHTFLSKPYHPADLAQAVRNALDGQARRLGSVAAPKS